MVANQDFEIDGNLKNATTQASNFVILILSSNYGSLLYRW